MKKIILVTPSLKTGGGNRVFFELANKLVANREVYFVYPNNSLDQNTFFVDKKIQFIPIGTYSNSNLKKMYNVILSIIYLNKNFSNDIILISEPIYSLFSKFIRCISLYRFIQADDFRIYDDRALLKNAFVLKLYKYFCLISYSNCNVTYIFNSRFTYDIFCKDSKRKDVDFRLVHPAINQSVFNAKQRINNNNDNNKINICHVARKHPWKGTVNLIHVLNKLPDNYKSKIGDVIFISHDDLSIFDTNGIKTFKPKNDIDIAQIYLESDIYISTSWWEGFGLPALEAMSCGCACIISKAGGINEYALPEENCLTFEPKNEDELSKQLMRLIDDKMLRLNIATRAIGDAKNFSWDKSANQLLDILK